MSFPAETKDEFVRLRDEIRRGTRVISLSGLTSIASKAFVLSKLQAETQKTFVVVTDSNKETETWECDLEFWSKKQKTEGEKSDSSHFSFLNSHFLTLPAFETRCLLRHFAARRNSGKTRARALEFDISKA